MIPAGFNIDGAAQKPRLRANKVLQRTTTLRRFAGAGVRR